jgi:hypothetical protein
MEIKELLKAIGIFLLAILIMLIINVGVVLIAKFVPILAWIIFGGALVGLFIIIYMGVRGY